MLHHRSRGTPIQPEVVCDDPGRRNGSNCRDGADLMATERQKVPRGQTRGWIRFELSIAPERLRYACVFVLKDGWKRFK